MKENQWPIGSKSTNYLNSWNYISIIKSTMETKIILWIDMTPANLQLIKRVNFTLNSAQKIKISMNLVNVKTRFQSGELSIYLISIQLLVVVQYLFEKFVPDISKISISIWNNNSSNFPIEVRIQIMTQLNFHKITNTSMVTNVSWYKNQQNLQRC